MINPIIIIAGLALVLSALVIALLNKPPFPIVAAVFICVLIFFVVTTYLIDSSIANAAVSDSFNGFVCFAITQSNPTYDDLSAAFEVYQYTDIGLFAVCLITMFTEVLTILHKNSEK